MLRLLLSKYLYSYTIVYYLYSYFCLMRFNMNLYVPVCFVFTSSETMASPSMVSWACSGSRISLYPTFPIHPHPDFIHDPNPLHRRSQNGHWTPTQWSQWGETPRVFLGWPRSIPKPMYPGMYIEVHGIPCVGSCWSWVLQWMSFTVNNCYFR